MTSFRQSTKYTSSEAKDTSLLTPYSQGHSISRCVKDTPETPDIIDFIAVEWEWV